MPQREPTPQDRQDAKGMFIDYLFNHFNEGDIQQRVEARYDTSLEKVSSGYGETIYQFALIPKGGRVIRNGSSRMRKAYPAPKNSIEGIPADVTLAYRGMSFEEWREARRRGDVFSRGGYNFEAQGRVTFFGTDPDQARIYANSFAPWPYKIAERLPGVVVAIPREILEEGAQYTVPGELVARDPVPLSKIVACWYLVPVEGKAGYVEIVFHGNRTSEGSRSSPHMTEAIVPCRERWT